MEQLKKRYIGIKGLDGEIPSDIICVKEKYLKK
jgi:hypothetical protein